MKKSLTVMAGLLALPILDYAGASFKVSVSDTAEAYVARRSAFVARGPAGGVVVGARRTAFARGYYAFPETSPDTYNEDRTESDSKRPEIQNSEDSRDSSNASEEKQ
ncbi:MAG TPA: hypothetical protein VFO10_11835 [Oligoflexus sp.]|uniref:hypothetical protein n=1 Tax=Oligoflexus sp. TaxID=1971216 RepID=UPI002D8035E4|nr:hypothetical protein [Oligoflexus sp.]HET9237938.1 hypothetical protein [Oligoflexus sp.]